MFARIILILLLAGCGSAPKIKSLTSEDISASYTPYTPGAGGGMGVDFIFEFPDTIRNVTVEELRINDEKMDAEVQTETPLKIVANRFYPNPEPTQENPVPDPPEAPLYNAPEYRALLTIEVKGRTKTFVIEDFKKNDPILYP